MQKLGPGSCFTDAAEAPILRIFWNKIAPKGGPTCRPYGSSGTWIFLNEITTKAGPTYRPYGQDAGLT